MTDAETGSLANPTDYLKISKFLCFAIYSAEHAFTRAYKPLLDELGLTYPQYLVMVALWEEDGQTVSRLGALLHLESNTLTPLIKRLEARKLLTRVRDQKDERQVRVLLSEEGKAMKAVATKIPECLFPAIGMSLEDVTRLQAELLKLRDSLETVQACPKSES